MKNIFTVAKFTILEMIRKKAFIVSLIITLLFVIIGFNIPNIIKMFKGENTKAKLIIKDENNAYTNLDIITSLDTKYEFVIDTRDIEEIKEDLTKEDAEVTEAIVITKDGNNLNFNYLVPNVSMETYIPEDILTLFTEVYKMEQLNNLGLTEEQQASINPVITTSITALGEEARGNILVMMFISIALFFAIYFNALQVSTSITLEKTSKIIETLVTSTKPRDIVVGKTLGVGLVGLAQSLLVFGTAVICAFVSLGRETLSAIVDLKFLTVGLALITVLYFILGYFAYAFLYALTGSTVSKPEDVQSANGPISMIAMVGFYLAYFTLMNPTSGLNKFAALFPFSSAFCVPVRVMMGLATPLELILSIGILILTTAFIAYISIKIYHNAILNYGSKLSFKDLVKMVKQK